MLSVNRWMPVAAGVALSLVLAGCGGSTSSSGDTGGSGGNTGTGGTGTGGTGTGGTGTGGTATGGSGGGTGGAPLSLADQGITQNDCAPNDGPAISVRIGTQSTCGDTPNGAAQVWFLAFPAQVDQLGVGSSWDSPSGGSGSLQVTWYPQGSSGTGQALTSGHLEVQNVDAGGGQIKFGYSFKTSDGIDYAGSATVLECASQPGCG